MLKIVPRVMIVDDDTDVRDSIEDVISLECDVEIETVGDIESFNQKFLEYNPAIVLIDIKLNNQNGLDLIPKIKQADKNTICVIMTAYRDMDYVVEALRRGADDFLFKPLDAAVIIKTISQYTKHYLLIEDNKKKDFYINTFYDHTSTSLFLLAPGGKILEVSKTALTKLNLSRDEVVNKPVLDLPFSDRDSAIALIKAAMQKISTTEKVGLELSLISNKHRIWFDFVLTPVLDEYNNLVLVVLEGHDISERKAVETLKNEFIATVSHELRTPLTSIIGSLGLLTGGVVEELSKDVLNMLNIAKSNADRLLLLINDLLDIEKIELGVLDFQWNSVEVKPLLNEALRLNQSFAQAQGIKLHIKETNDGVFIHADSNRIIQVLNNLISNAIKFSQAGSIVELACKKSSSNVQIVVQDYGTGIPEPFRAKIFNKFSQNDSTSTRRVGGTGLGLSITKAIVEKHNGVIRFDTTEGQGTTFYVEIPLQNN